MTFFAYRGSKHCKTQRVLLAAASTFIFIPTLHVGLLDLKLNSSPCPVYSLLILEGPTPKCPCQTLECPWSAQPQSLPCARPHSVSRVPGMPCLRSAQPRVFLECPTPEYLFQERAGMFEEKHFSSCPYFCCSPFVRFPVGWSCRACRVRVVHHQCLHLSPCCLPSCWMGFDRVLTLSVSKQLFLSFLKEGLWAQSQGTPTLSAVGQHVELTLLSTPAPPPPPPLVGSMCRTRYYHPPPPHTPLLSRST